MTPENAFDRTPDTFAWTEVLPENLKQAVTRVHKQLCGHLWHSNRPLINVWVIFPDDMVPDIDYEAINHLQATVQLLQQNNIENWQVHLSEILVGKICIEEEASASDQGYEGSWFYIKRALGKEAGKTLTELIAQRIAESGCNCTQIRRVVNKIRDELEFEQIYSFFQLELLPNYWLNQKLPVLFNRKDVHQRHDFICAIESAKLMAIRQGPIDFYRLIIEIRKATHGATAFYDQLGEAEDVANIVAQMLDVMRKNELTALGIRRARKPIDTQPAFHAKIDHTKK